MPEPTPVFAASLQFALIAAGLVLLWRCALSPRARATRPEPRLGAWTIPGTDFLRFLLVIVCGTLIAGMVGTLLLKLRPLAGPPKIIFLTGCSHAGMIAGVAVFKLSLERIGLKTAALQRSDFVSGAVTFLIAMPVLVVVTLPWRALLTLCGLDLDHQELVDMFLQARSPALLVVMIVLATVTAPVAEEMLFRAGFFRFVRTRAPRWVALLGPACLFSALHQNLASFAPLVALGVVFSLAYERTGRIGTAIVAHSLFNLYAVVQVFAGVT
jgi:membrane protease YdiL (CAAX protease family)